MNCEMVSERLPELLNGALDRETELAVLGHLAQCEQCRKELAFWARMGQAMRQDAEETPGDTIREVRAELFGSGLTSAWESVRATGQALGLAGTACRLAFSAVR